jgi:hypothetical protein
MEPVFIPAGLEGQVAALRESALLPATADRQLWGCQSQAYKAVGNGAADLQESSLADSLRPIAGAAIFDLLHPKRPFKLEFLGQLSGDDFINPSTGHWPTADTRD